MKDLFKQLSYDKISDDLCLLGYNTVLRFNVGLSKPTQEGKRYHYHQEYEYSTNKYIDTNKLMTIRRQFDFYMSIENLRQNDSGIKEYIMIRIQDIIYVRQMLNLATKWFTEYDDLFAVKDNKTILLGNVNPIFIDGLASGKYLKLEPTVITYNNDSTTSGIRMYLSAPDNYVDMSIDRFMGLVYLIDSINMYESAQLLLNYLQRPEFGTNLYSFDNRKDPDIDEEAGFVDTKSTSRKIGDKKKQKSFFDKMDNI